MENWSLYPWSPSKNPQTKQYINMVSKEEKVSERERTMSNYLLKREYLINIIYLNKPNA